MRRCVLIAALAACAFAPAGCGGSATRLIVRTTSASTSSSPTTAPPAAGIGFPILWSWRNSPCAGEGDHGQDRGQWRHAAGNRQTGQRNAFDRGFALFRETFCVFGIKIHDQPHDGAGFVIAP